MKNKLKHRKNVLIIGAGECGRMVVDEIYSHSESGYEPVGFIDDDTAKIKSNYKGVVVLGNREYIKKAVEDYDVSEIIIAMPSIKGSIIRDFIARCEKLKVGFKVVPGLREIITGNVTFSQIREFRAEDLLGRESQALEIGEAGGYLTGKIILITGAGGSIGSEIARVVAKFNPLSLILFGHGENSIHELSIELSESQTDIRLIPFIGDIRDSTCLKKLFEAQKPEIIFHAAAHKHIYLMEKFPCEAVFNNVIGTWNVLKQAELSQCERFVMLSTDKAVNPVSVMGATKRACELIIQAWFTHHNGVVKPVPIMVRFGNVLGSRGSVVPILQRQIAKSRILTITHPNVTRFFMTVKEAAHLVVKSGHLGRGGEIFILNMGEPIRIIDLAKNMAILSGLDPQKDICFSITGLKDGEKLDEEILTCSEGLTTTKFEKIFIARQEPVSWIMVESWLQEVKDCLRKQDNKKMIVLLENFIDEYAAMRKKIRH